MTITRAVWVRGLSISSEGLLVECDQAVGSFQALLTADAASPVAQAVVRAMLDQTVATFEFEEAPADVRPADRPRPVFVRFLGGLS